MKTSTFLIASTLVTACGTDQSINFHSQIVLLQNSVIVDDQVISYYRSPLPPEVRTLIQEDFKVTTNVQYKSILFIGSREISLTTYNNALQSSDSTYLEMSIVTGLADLIYEMPILNFERVKRR